MATIFDVFPPEVFINQVFPALPAGSICCFNRVSKAANAIVGKAAKESQDDMTLEGKITPIVLDGTVAAFIRQRYKMQILTTRQDLLNNLKIVRDAVLAHNNFAESWGLETSDPDRIIDIYNQARKTGGIKDAMLPIVLFDFNAKQIPAKGHDGLAGLLRNAANDTNLELVRMILKHPNAPNIPSKQEAFEELSVQNTLAIVIEKTDSVETVLQFLAHPQIAKSCGIPLSYAILAKKPTMVKAILAHPNAANIPADGTCGLSETLRMTTARYSNLSSGTNFRNEYKEIVQEILSHPNAVNISTEVLDKAREFLKP
jgi:hypothetical protein